MGVLAGAADGAAEAALGALAARLGAGEGLPFKEERRSLTRSRIVSSGMLRTRAIRAWAKGSVVIGDEGRSERRGTSSSRLTLDIAGMADDQVEITHVKMPRPKLKQGVDQLVTADDDSFVVTQFQLATWHLGVVGSFRPHEFIVGADLIAPMRQRMAGDCGARSNRVPWGNVIPPPMTPSW